MSPRLLDFFFIMDGALHEMRNTCGNCDIILNYGETEWMLPQLLYADDGVSSAKSEGRSKDVWRRRMLRENANKSKTLVFERDGGSERKISLLGEKL